MTGFGFDRESAEKIAKVVRGALGSAGGVKSHRRADTSGPGNHVALAEITEASGNTHKFRFVAASYVEDVGSQSTTYQDLPDEYYAHDLCADALSVGDYVWIVDHNNQWFIVEKCIGPGGSGGADGGCCGGCSDGVVTGCAETPKLCHNSYYFDITRFVGEIDGQIGCCDQLMGPIIVYHDSGCTWKSADLDLCDDVGGVPPTWKLVIAGDDPWEVVIKVEIDTTGDGTADKIVEYKNPNPYCCNCVNEFVLVCPDNLPVGCDQFPCKICVMPGPKCCTTAKMATSLTATITAPNPSFNCPCAHNTTIGLDYRPQFQDWFGSGAFCAETIELTLSCNVDGGGCGDFILDVRWLTACHSGGTYGVDAANCTCDPLSLPFEAIAADGCCGTASTGANVTITITE